MFGGAIGPGEILIVLFVILLLFGAKRLPELARGMGKGIREFKKATSGIEEEMKLEEKTKEKTEEKTKENEKKAG
ncbi:MAG: twin-arginine translocase TatA/TatE family subunit [Gemmatimonadota bacterium]|nr:MAG: twin-arginine translocase TatA/TatE family subunit [Gemmatimonadota bacterium]